MGASALVSLAGSRTGYGAWIGLAVNKNALGYLSLVCALLWFAELVRTRDIARTAPFLLLGIAVCLLTRSTTSLAALLAALGSYGILTILRRNGPGVLAIITFGLVAAATSAHLAATLFGFPTPFEFFDWLTGVFGKDPTMTGRVLLWQAMFEEIGRHPWLGGGFGAFWVDDGRSVGLALPSSHSGYIDLVNGLGFVGLGLFVALLLSHVRKLARVLRAMPGKADVHLLILVAGLVLNIAESALFRQIHLWSILISLSIVEVAWLSMSLRSQRARASWQPSSSIVLRQSARA